MHCAPAEVRACYAVIVGRAASADGSVLVGHNEENAGKRVLYFHKIPRQQHAPGDSVQLRRGGRLEQVPQTGAMLWSENPGLEFSDSYLNEWGVAVVSDACPSREDGYDALAAGGEIRKRGIGYMPRRLGAWRGQTARQGVELMGRLVERFGYVDSGRTYVVADPDEAWLVAVVRGRRWVAQRVPDDQVVILPNVYIIGEVDLSDASRFLASPDLVSYASQRNWFDARGAAKFDFRRAYQARNRPAPDPRQLRGQAIVTGKDGAGPLPFSVVPHKKMTVADVAAVLRDNAGAVPLFQKSTQEAAVFQLRSRLPREIGCVYWRTTGRPDISVLTPWHVGITSTPDAYHPRGDTATQFSLEHHFQPPPGTFDVDSRLAWWRFKALEELVDLDYAGRIRTVRAVWSVFEEGALRRQETIEAEALRIWQTSPDAARSYLTRCCAEMAGEACSQADRLCAGFRAQGGK